MKKCLVFYTLVCLFMLSACSSGAAISATSIQVAENQELVIGQVSEINGNEMTLALAKEVTANSSANNGSNVTRSAGETDSNASGNYNSGKNGSAGGFSGGNAGSRQRPSGASGETMPSGGNMPGGARGETMPSGGNMPFDMQNRDAQSGQANASTNDSSRAAKNNASIVTYVLTGETLTTTIPVGTAVTTQLGTITTFSRLAVGDTIKILMQKDDDGKNVPVSVWIVG